MLWKRQYSKLHQQCIQLRLEGRIHLSLPKIFFLPRKALLSGLGIICYPCIKKSYLGSKIRYLFFLQCLAFWFFLACCQLAVGAQWPMCVYWWMLADFRTSFMPIYWLSGDLSVPGIRVSTAQQPATANAPGFCPLFSIRHVLIFSRPAYMSHMLLS